IFGSWRNAQFKLWGGLAFCYMRNAHSGCWRNVQCNSVVLLLLLVLAQRAG
ncbi:hypothetical protein A2U01_0075723, partial [Trifolium medium]|nr:hypothetical protein [Trifolium medium]